MRTEPITPEWLDATATKLIYRAAFCVQQAHAEMDTPTPGHSFARHYLGKAEGLVGAIVAFTGRTEYEVNTEVSRLAEEL